MAESEVLVAQFDELQDGDMKQVTVGNTDVLLARVDGAYHAVYAYCTHYGAPLAEGVLSSDRLVCPWHHACFQLPSGDQLEPPGLDSLPRFEVRIDGTDVFVCVPEEIETHRPPRMIVPDCTDDRMVVVLGAGAAGAYAVEALREAGFAGRVRLITQEAVLPYDRPNCSKDYLQGEVEAAWMPLRSEAFYAEHGIEVWQGRQVIRADTADKILHFADGETITYDRLILCTGCTPRQLDVPGKNLDGVMTLRSYADSDLLREAAQSAQQAVVVGASFIGMEVAYSLRQLGLAVTVVAPESVPFDAILGPQVGHRLQAEHEKHGVRFVLDATVQALHGEQTVKRVVLNNGTVLDADLVVVGIGVQPATGFLHGVERAADGSVIVDASLCARPGVYAAGDIAQFPDWRSGEPVRIEHWRLACQHGRLAGYNAAGRSMSYRSVPYFWTVQFDLHLHYVGHATEWEDILFDGDPQGEQFMAYYVKGDTVRAVAGVNCDRDMAAVHELMRRELLPVPAPELIQRDTFDPIARLREAIAQ